MTTGIYKITNKINGKMYIGLSTNIEKRFREHKTSIKSKQLIHKAIQKYGIDNFAFDIIAVCPKGCLNLLETVYIRELNTMVPNGYNLTIGGEGTTGFKFTEEQIIALKSRKHTDESKRKMSESHKKMIGNLNSFYGKQHTEEVKTKISNSKKGKSAIQNKKRVIYNETKFDCIGDLILFLNVSKSVFYRNMRKGIYGIEIEK